MLETELRIVLLGIADILFPSSSSLPGLGEMSAKNEEQITKPNTAVSSLG